MLSLVSHLFGYFVRRRNLQFDCGARQAISVGVPVVSVGNLSVGGTGKTPTIQALVEIVQDLGYRPGIVGRGYGKSTKGTVVVSDGKDIFYSASQAGDEMIMLAQKCRVPVIADESKTRAAIEMAKVFSPDCIFVDDGFQHRGLARNLDLVIVDKKTLDRPFLLPKGRLREPLSSLARADAILLPYGTMLTAEAKQFVQTNTPVVEFRVQTDCPYRVHIDSTQRLTSHPTGVGVAFCGIANPERFYSSLKEMAIHCAESISFKDHKAYSEASVRHILDSVRRHNANFVITTEKDNVKMSEFFDIFASAGIDCYVLPIATNFADDKQQVISMIKKLFVK